MRKAYSWEQGRKSCRLGGAALALLVYGCGPQQDASSLADSQAQTPQRTGAAAGSTSPRHVAANQGALVIPGPVVVTPVGPDAVATPVDARPAALVNGRGVSWGELRPALTEAYGAEALREHILDQRLDEALSRAQISLAAGDLARERRLLLDSLDPEPNQALRLLEELRERQRLGPYRFERLLRRNAALRALIAGRAQVSEGAIHVQFDIVHGPRRQARIIVVPTLKAAEEAITRVKGGETFADVAVKVSTDASAARGGLLEAISAEDPRYPKALRDAIWTLAPMQISSPILLESSFAIAQMISETPADGSNLADVRPELERMVRLAQEQAMMDQLARQLTEDVTVTIFDESLKQSWNSLRSRQ